MSMMGEIATEGTIRAICAHIEKEMAVRSGQPDAIAALKAVGRKALTEFDWSTPDWAERYEKLFSES